MPLRANVSSAWYFQPKFFVKVIWGIFALALTMVLIVFAGKENDPFWTHVVGKQPYNLLVTVLIFFLIAVGATLAVFFVDKLDEYRKWILIGIIADTALFYILGFVFVGKFGTIRRREEFCETVKSFYANNQATRSEEIKTIIKWFEDNVARGGDADFSDEVFEYVDDRTEDIGSAIIGCFVVWGIFDAIWMWHLFGGEKPECFETRGEYQNAA